LEENIMMKPTTRKPRPMPKNSPPPRPWLTVQLEELAVKLKNRTCAFRLWEGVFTQAERDRLGGDVETAWRQYGTAGMWLQLRRVSRNRAFADVTRSLNLIDEATHRRLLRELGEIHDDPEEGIEAAVASGALVLVEGRREAYWAGKPIPGKWRRRSAVWDFFVLLAKRSKAGLTVDHTHFPSSKNRGIATKQKSRLTSLVGFPQDLADHMISAGRYTHRIDLPATQIRILEVRDQEILHDYCP
jgi:hypothetical protein